MQLQHGGCKKCKASTPRYTDIEQGTHTCITHTHTHVTSRSMHINMMVGATRNPGGLVLSLVPNAQIKSKL